MEILRWKNINKIQLSLQTLWSAIRDVSTWWFLRRSSILRLIYDSARRRTFSTFFKQDQFLNLVIINLRMQLHTNMLCKTLKAYEWLNQKWQEHFLFLSKSDINSVLKKTFAKFCPLRTPQTYPGHDRCVKFQLCIICGAYFSWIKVQSPSETVQN